MERLSEIYSTVADLYGAEGIALAAIILAAFAIEIYYYAGIYAPIAGFRLQKRKKIRDAQPPVSVIVPIFSENLAYLDEGLVELLTQDYDRFEVVAVYVGNDRELLRRPLASAQPLSASENHPDRLLAALSRISQDGS